ncbi:MAG: 1-acyl-sn-glycerol-3-phosphate acyltransferase [Myxococcales bacterium]|nr:1-acyl-sn-glycerol-3-phosphate acyltransferase [Myxococcales bacterium]
MNACRNTFALARIIWATLVWGDLALLAALLGFTGPVIDRVTRRWCRAVASAGGMRVAASGLDNVDARQNYVVVANHRSHLDTVALYLTCPVPLRMLAKVVLFKIPVFGWAMRLTGHIPVERERAGGQLEKIRPHLERLRAAGRSLCVFPEGIRQRAGTLGDFKLGAFVIAVESGLPILPVSIEGTRRILPPKRLRFTPGEARVRFHPPFSPAGLTPDELRARVRKILWDDLAAGSGD